MATIDTGTAAIIGICVALGVCLIILIIFVILYCRVKIQPDTNIRKRIISTATPGGYVEQQTKTDIYHAQAPVLQPVAQPYVVPAPVSRRPLPRRQYVQEEYISIPAPQPQPQPEVVIHEVVHRYEPTPPALMPQPQAPAPQPPPTRTIIRSNSWSAPPVQDDWIMIKKTKKQRSPKIREVRRVPDDSSSSSSEDEEEESRTRQPGRPGVQYVMPSMMRSLNPYDLAMPSIYQSRPQIIGMAPMTTTVPVAMSPMGMAPMGMAPMGMSPMGMSPMSVAPIGMAQIGVPTMAGMNYMTTAQQAQPAVNTAVAMPMMSATGGVTSFFQPTYAPYIQRM